MKYYLCLPLLFLYCCISMAQPGATELLREAGIKLENKSANVSAILIDKKYLSLHPLTAFRDLIRTYASPGILQVTTDDEPGKKIRVQGTIKDKEGKPAAGALVYLYQTDSKGWYAADAPHVRISGSDVGHARLFGYVRTDANGKFELHTIKPSGYPRSDLPAHIHVHVSVEGYRAVVNEFLFDDDERLVGEIREQSVRNRFLIAQPEEAPAPFDQQFSYTIHLEK